MSDDNLKAVEAMRKKVNSVLMALTPAEAKALRARFGITTDGVDPEEEVGSLRALARELARLKKKKT